MSYCESNPGESEANDADGGAMVLGRIRSETIVGYGLPIERDGAERIFGSRMNVVGIHILQEMVVVNKKGGEEGVLSIIVKTIAVV